MSAFSSCNCVGEWCGRELRSDQALEHQDAFLLMCKSVPPLNRREVNDALNVAKNMAEHLLLFMDGIDTFYAKFDTVPRLPCDPLSE